MRHFGMEPRTIEPGQKQQNGDVEALNGALKRRLEQHLLLRGDREVELAAMRLVRVERLAEYTEVDVVVSSWSTIRIKHNAYSVPSRLTGERVRVRVFEARLEIFYAGRHQLTVERRRGENGHRIDYRHIIWSLVRKPGAFARYRYRDELFPTPAFRRACERSQYSMAPPPR
jgi:hypothetical protein